MSSLIEQAAQRLEQLRQAGVSLPDLEPAATAAGPGVAADLPPTPAAPMPAAAVARPEAVFTSKRVEIDLDAVATAGIVTPNAPRTHLADQYRVLKRPLIASSGR